MLAGLILVSMEVPVPTCMEEVISAHVLLPTPAVIAKHQLDS